MVRLIFLLLAFFFLQSLQATHNRAGEIVYRQIGNLTIQASIITFTLPSSISADRDSLEINWGDGSSQLILRVNGPDVDGNGVPDGEFVTNDYKKNIYTAEHTYGQQGSFKLSMLDPNREREILNINFPNPDAIPFYIQTLVTFDTDLNNSPVILQDPIDVGFVNTPFVYYPSAFDVDDDSIAYRLVTPLMGENMPVTNYQSPTNINPGVNNMIFFDEPTGRLIWLSPQMEGIYNIAIEVLSYRNGVLNGSVLRDMQILVLPEFNLLASITILTDFDIINEVEVGDTVNIQINAMDDDMDQAIDMDVTSGLMEYFSEPPMFNFVDNNTNNENASFSWIVKMEHLRKQPYDIVFRAIDNLGLTNYKLLRYKVKDIIESTGEELYRKPFDVFPNPVGHTLFIKNGKFNSENYQILSSSGRLIKSGELNLSKGIDVANLATGVYYLKIEGCGIVSFVKG